MPEDRAHSKLFGVLIQSLLARGLGFRFRACGRSMRPTIQDGEILHVRPVSVETLRRGDIVLFADGTHFRAHRLVSVDHQRNVFLTRGDSGEHMDAPLRAEQILGRVVAKEEILDRRPHVVRLCGMWATTRFLALQSRNLVSKMGRQSSFLMATKMVIQKRVFGAAGLFLLLGILFSGQAVGQIVADTATTGIMTAVAATTSLTFTHTTGGTNRLLVVGVSLNVVQNPTTIVTGVTYNGVALTQAVAHNDAGPTRRAEIWYLVSPPVGTNLNVVVTVSAPTGGNQVGVVAGAILFTGTDQTTAPIRSVASNNGAAAAGSTLNIASATGDLVLDTLAVQGNSTAAAGAGQTAQWGTLNTARSSNNATPGVRGFGSTEAGAASVTSHRRGRARDTSTTRSAHS